MSDPEFRQVLTETVDDIRYRNRRTMLGGRRIDATTVTLIGAPEGKSWVRGFDQSREETAVWGSVNSINAAVEIDMRPDGDYQILDPDWSLAVATHGDAARSVTQPPGNEAVPQNIPAVAFTEARLEASQNEADPMKVHTRAFMFQGHVHLGGSFDGAGNFDPTTYDASVAAYVPSGSGTACWVGRYFDPDDETFHFVAGALEYWPSAAYLIETTLDALDIPVGCYYAGAVALAYGQTTVVGGRFASWREFVGKRLDARLDDVDSMMDDWLVARLQDGARITRPTALGGRSRRLNDVAARLLRKPYGGG